MVQVNSIVKPLIVLTVWATIFLAGCVENSATPTSTQVPPNGPPSVNSTLTGGTPGVATPDSGNVQINEVESLPPPTDNFTNTAAVFLLDISTSIEDLCEPEFQAWRTDIPEFFITYAHAYHHNEHGRDEEFKIGWTTFPTPSGQSFDLNLKGLSDFDNYTDWNEKLKGDLVSSSTGLGFADALDNTVEQLRGNEYSGYQKVIFLVSETYLDYKRDSSEEVVTEKARIAQSLNNIPTDWRLYIIQLPCSLTNSDYGQDRRSSDTGWWRETVKDDTHILLFDRNNMSTLKSVADALFKNNNDTAMKNLLPWDPQAGQHGWGWIDGNNTYIYMENGNPATWQTDGDTSHLDITVVATGANGFQLLQGVSTVGNRSYPIPNSNIALLYTYAYDPKQISDGNCENYEWRFQPITSSQNTAGIFWWQVSYPALQLSVNVDPPGILNNDRSFSITAMLRGGDDACYQSQLKINHQIYRNAQGHPELKNIINMSWNDIAYDPSKIPLHFPVAVEILRRNPNIVSGRAPNLVLNVERLVDVSFTPVLQNSSVHADCPYCAITETTTIISMTFDYAAHHHFGVPAPLNPEIYLLTIKTRSEQVAIENDKACNQGFLGVGNVVPVLFDGNYVLGEHTPLLYAYRVGADNGRLQFETGASPEFMVTVTANIPKSWQYYCAYTHLLLQWPDEINQDNWHSVYCPLEDGGLCVNHNDRVIRR